MLKIYIIITSFLNFLDTFTLPTYQPDKALNNYILDMFLMVGWLSTSFFSAMVSAHFFIFPRSLCYVTSDLPPNASYFWVIWTGVYFTNCAMGTGTLLGIITSYLSIYYFAVIPIFTKELKLKKNATYVTKPILRTNVENLTFVYRTIEILHNLVISGLGILIVPLQTIMLQIGLFCNLMLVRNGNELPFFVFILLVGGSLVSTIGWGIILQFSGRIFELSKKTLNSWKSDNLFITRRRDVKYLMTFKKSCKPLRVGYGKYYNIKPVSVLTFLKGVVRGTFRAILTLKKY